MSVHKWTIHTGVAVSIPREDIDTDQILPKQFMKLIDKRGFGKHLFFDWRYLDLEGKILNPEFALNQDGFKNASVLIACKNFGCGSSREHAPWALSDFGFRAILSPSFADIFSINAAKNGIALVRLKEDEIHSLGEWVSKNPGSSIRINLEKLEVQAGEKTFYFHLDTASVNRIRNGWDDIDSTLKNEREILEFEQKRKMENSVLEVYW
ncbi:3-isopropylmalate dehydratase small subunit [Leptospira sp. 2 VSF19]|uniref:3-isopropylmalate dehydratase small subunit n=1 Tax=Leptospira soteropolitanensis TaxID=2950025 RepID=A0AAW5VPM9_9LEPT|nr:3-isopropylmalate dehydratase small subunit [Leptospira soteropolitanensis]MCW7494417.1 3-isopropylmalate dehydratase small subunit [Leptospira soteropolitanensis]MCW7502012.1 3-isopropylmalate dehydratase small subunit [Leptospira soteropolitanensis]MCW7524263.1 3-isopropylmalate dehydratase small subunit [Leptospira soteropolitanensis]MCW7528128.1 3-isopropylmalate dehydratase small subunit [Leptospira soteropolitanensis]MCW7531982.1 3-isopropylmalate dehydratase small subunit [Leptospira